MTYSVSERTAVALEHESASAAALITLRLMVPRAPSLRFRGRHVFCGRQSKTWRKKQVATMFWSTHSHQTLTNPNANTGMTLNQIWYAANPRKSALRPAAHSSGSAWVLCGACHRRHPKAAEAPWKQPIIILSLAGRLEQVLHQQGFNCPTRLITKSSLDVRVFHILHPPDYRGPYIMRSNRKIMSRQGCLALLALPHPNPQPLHVTSFRLPCS
jgi:hypothetical protein